MGAVQAQRRSDLPRPHLSGLRICKAGEREASPPGSSPVVDSFVP
jgi:hypothetical protein